ncbi:hypothetical protein BpOF4_16160 [Alkalihalophilus pseudofirmus OF4]|uniref:Uncharacterized protein n=1 Tax=Alkalihalophilus pseudofirmus (strain ATCC BAA-2126 / JCM 17055 / OF4) TaxID=398511 RepID=D3FPY8_ALKPO|nr:hypothetical protein BpOF4_16160 [Alkalihalophilus pseudofirmus OF4]
MEGSSRYCKLTYDEIAERYLSGQSSEEIGAAAGVTS